MQISISSSDFLNGYDNLIREDGMINATLLCKAGKKLLSNYYQNKQTKEYLDALSIETGIPITELFVTTACRYGGTWIHHLVATHLAQWISIDFSIKSIFMD